jgi:hypothetical protein
MVIDQYGVQKQRICPVSDDSFPEHYRDLSRTAEGAAISVADGEKKSEAEDREGGRWRGEGEERERERREEREREENIIDMPSV